MSEITQPVKKRPANEISAPSAAKQAKANAPKKRAGSNNAPATIIGLTEETEYVAAVPAVVAAPSLIAAPSPSLPVPMAAPRTSTTSSSATPIITSENHVIEQNKKVLGQLPNGDYRKKCKFCKNKTSYYCTTCTVDGGRVAYCCKADTDCFKTVHGTISGAENDDVSLKDLMVLHDIFYLLTMFCLHVHRIQLYTFWRETESLLLVEIMEITAADALCATTRLLTTARNVQLLSKLYLYVNMELSVSKHTILVLMLLEIPRRVLLTM